MYVDTEDYGGPERGIIRERELCKLLKTNYGGLVHRKSNSGKEDIFIFNYPVQVKHLSARYPNISGFKLKWGGNFKNQDTYIKENTGFNVDHLIIFISSIWCTVVLWDHSVMNEVLQELGTDFYKKLNHTNSRGVEISSVASKAIQDKGCILKIDITFSHKCVTSGKIRIYTT